MPIYEYRCDGCQAVFEVFQKASDPPPARHECGSTAVHRQLSHTSFVLKGTGWYKTDYPSAKEAAGRAARAGEAKADAAPQKDAAAKDAASPAPAAKGGEGQASAPAPTAAPAPAAAPKAGGRPGAAG